MVNAQHTVILKLKLLKNVLPIHLHKSLDNYQSVQGLLHSLMLNVQ